MKKPRARRDSAGAKRKTRRARENKRPAHAGEKRTADRGAISARGVHLSIQQAAEEFGHDRKTIAKRIRELGIQADGKRQGYDVFRLRDLLAIERATEAGKIDPDKLGPFERNAYYKSETERIELGKQIGSLVQREDMEREVSRVLALTAQELEIVVDEIERDVGAPGPVMEALERKLDGMRERLYQRIVTNQDLAADAAAPAGDGTPVPSGQ